MAEGGRADVRSGDALFAFDTELRIRSWNRAVEELTGVPAEEAVGRFCWEVLGGEEADGAIVCGAGCSHARHAREGWPVPCHELLIRTLDGRRRMSLSTIALKDREQPLFLHLMREAPEPPKEEAPPSVQDPPPYLTPRQLEVLKLLGEGFPARVISRRLGVAETTVRNHIRAVLLELRCHSQLEAVVKARSMRIL